MSRLKLPKFRSNVQFSMAFEVYSGVKESSASPSGSISDWLEIDAPNVTPPNAQISLVPILTKISEDGATRLIMKIETVVL